jgi:hypothetical protein
MSTHRTSPKVFVTHVFMGGRNHQIPSQEFLSETAFRQDAGVRGGRHPSPECRTRPKSLASSFPKPLPRREAPLLHAALLMAGSFAVVGVLTLTLL